MNPVIVIPTYRRIEYLARCLTAVARLPEVIGGLPVCVSIDHSDQQELAVAIVYYFKKINSHIIVRPKRMGLMRHLVALRCEMFEKYDAVCLIEDDVQVTAQYFTLMSNAMRWLTEHYDNCSVVGSNIYARWTPEQAEMYAPVLTDSGHSICNYLMLRQAWEKLYPFMGDYASAVQEGATSILDLSDDSANLPHRRTKTRDWMKTLHFSKAEGPRKIHCTFDPNIIYKNNPVCGQDALTDVCLRLAGMGRVTTIVNRAIHFSTYGEHAFEGAPSVIRYFNTQLVERVEDSTLTEFQLR